MIYPSETDLKNILLSGGLVEKKCSQCSSTFYSLSGNTSTLCGDGCECYDVPHFLDFKRVLVTTDSIEKSFMEFFKNKGFYSYPPANLLCKWKDDTHFTQASIYLFQPHILSYKLKGIEEKVSFSQPCLRLTDIPELGNGRHAIFFHMLTHTAFNSEELTYGVEDTLLDCLLFFNSITPSTSFLTFKISTWSGGGNSGSCYEVFLAGTEVATLVFMNGGVIPNFVVDTGYGLERIVSAVSGLPLEMVYYPEHSIDDFPVLHVLSTTYNLFQQGLVPQNKGNGFHMKNLFKYLFQKASIDCSSWNRFFTVLPDSNVKTNFIEVFYNEFKSYLSLFSKWNNKINSMGSLTTQEADVLYESKGVPIEVIKNFLPDYKFIPYNTAKTEETIPNLEHLDRGDSSYNWYCEEVPLTHQLSEYTLSKEGLEVEVFSKTSFYPGGGGQISDIATVNGQSFTFQTFTNSLKLFFNEPVEGPLILEIDPQKRKDISRWHTAAHVVMELFGIFIGRPVLQASAEVSHDYLRFDIYFPSCLDIHEVMDNVVSTYNDYCRSNCPLTINKMSRVEWEKNRSPDSLDSLTPSVVRFQRIFFPFNGGFEIDVPCGGTHVSNSSDLEPITYKTASKGYNRTRIYLHKLQD